MTASFTLCGITHALTPALKWCHSIQVYLLPPLIIHNDLLDLPCTLYNKGPAWGLHAHRPDRGLHACDPSWPHVHHTITSFRTPHLFPRVPEDLQPKRSTEC